MKILVIDDEPIIRRALLRAFKVHDHDVQLAEDATVGERLWLELCPDVVMLDVLMPKITGPQLLAKMKPQLEKLKTKVILMSAYTGEFDTKLTVHKGAHMFLSKPFNDIFAVVKTVEGLIR